MIIVLLANVLPLLATSPTLGEDPASRFIRLLTVFLLAMWVGFEVITKVPQRLHTPLTSGSNAISGVTVVGALVVVVVVVGVVSAVVVIIVVVVAGVVGFGWQTN